MCEKYLYDQKAFPLTQEQFREFLKTNAGPFEPSDAHKCPLAAALLAAGHTYVTVGTHTAFWQPAGSEDPCRAATSELPEWAFKFRSEYDYSGRYDNGVRLEGENPLVLFTLLFPEPALPEKPSVS